MPIKKQFPRLIFILLNEMNEEVPEKYDIFISCKISEVNELEGIVGQIYEENEKIKYSEQGKNPSR